MIPVEMRVLAHVHGFPPHHNAGAEFYLLDVLRFLAARGHEVDVMSLRAGAPYEIDGIRVHGKERLDQKLHRACDVMITHLDDTRRAVAVADSLRKPLVHLVHNHLQLAHHQVAPSPRTLAVFNSEWLRTVTKWRGASVVVRPPLQVARYATAPAADRTAVTLINASEPKGIRVMFDLSKLEPDREYLAVAGSYGRQETPVRWPKVKLIPNTPDIREVYRRTRVLLMPSSYESWGRVGAEAMCSGIPVIAHPTPGLMESLGPAGIFVAREYPALWAAALRKLDDPDEYGYAADLAWHRALEIQDQTEADLIDLEKRLAEF